MTWPIVELAFWSPGDGRSPAIDALLLEEGAPLARHGLTGLAADYARDAGIPLASAHASWSAEMAARSLGVDGALVEVVRTFDDTGIDYFVAKGPILAHGIYATPAIRPYADLDLYVPARSHNEAAQTLEDLGYGRVSQATGPLGGVGTEWHGGRYGAVVELHSALVDNAFRRVLPRLEDLMVRVSRTEVLGCAVPALDPIWHAALQLVHLGAGHRFSKLILLRDMYEQLEHLTSHDLPAFAHRYRDIAIDALATFGVADPRRPRSLRTALAAKAITRRAPERWNEFGLNTPNLASVVATTPWSLLPSLGYSVLRAAARGGPRRYRFPSRGEFPSRLPLLVSDALVAEPSEGAQVMARALSEHLRLAHAGSSIGGTTCAEPRLRPYVGLKVIAELRRRRPSTVVYLPASGLTGWALARSAAIWLGAGRPRFDLIVLQDHLAAASPARRFIPRSWTVISAGRRSSVADESTWPTLRPRVDHRRVALDISRDEARAKLGLPLIGPIFLHLGHATHGRNLSVLRPLADHGTLVIVLSPRFPEIDGTVPSGPGITVVRGHRDDLGLFYRAASLYVFPIVDPHAVINVPLGIFEALANGTPALAIASEIIEPWRSTPGLYIAPDAPSFLDLARTLSSSQADVPAADFLSPERCADDLSTCRASA